MQSQTKDDDLDIHEMSGDFAVTDEASANWLIRKIVEARAYGQRVSKWAEREQARAARQEDFFMFRYGPQLRRWATAQIEAQGGRRKSVNLPAGSVGFRQKALRIHIQDQVAVLAWARIHHPELIVMKEHLNKTAFNAYVRQTGDVPSVGIELEPATDAFYVR